MSYLAGGRSHGVISTREPAGPDRRFRATSYSRLGACVRGPITRFCAQAGGRSIFVAAGRSRHQPVRSGCSQPRLSGCRPRSSTTALRTPTTPCTPTGAARAGAQAEALHRLLCRWHPGPADIADVACGIGTQLIGLAGLGHRVTASDISARAVRRARREGAAAGVHAGLLVADMRSLPLRDSCADAVVCADNALPHLLADSDALAALAQMRRVLRPGGTAIVTTRDYDRVLADPPAATLPQVYTSGAERVISFQLWTWRAEAGFYDLEHFQVREHADGTRATESRTAAYRAYTLRRAHRACLCRRPAGHPVAHARRIRVLPARHDRQQPRLSTAQRCCPDAHPTAAHDTTANSTQQINPICAHGTTSSKRPAPCRSADPARDE
jgi:glycine/sarcosine N-methyltransferase